MPYALHLQYLKYHSTSCPEMYGKCHYSCLLHLPATPNTPQWGLPARVGIYSGVHCSPSRPPACSRRTDAHRHAGCTLGRGWRLRGRESWLGQVCSVCSTSRWLQCVLCPLEGGCQRRCLLKLDRCGRILLILCLLIRILLELSFVFFRRQVQRRF